MSKSVLVKCKIKGKKKFGLHYSSEGKKQELCGTFESKGGEITARVKTNKAFLDRNRCYLRLIHWAERSDCLLRVMRNIISGLAVPMTATSGTGSITGGASIRLMMEIAIPQGSLINDAFTCTGTVIYRVVFC